MKTKDSLRPAPAFQEYAADMLANRNFRVMSLEERGLLMTLRYECWVNQSVPANCDELAKTLGVPEVNITKAMTHRVKSFFTVNGQEMVCDELDAYRTQLSNRREAMSKGGRNGGVNTQSKHKSNQATLEGTLKPLSGVQKSGVEKSKNQSSGRSNLNNIETDEWLEEYDKHL
jgi:uncharacterized protein YdaU (DUF1376 family)